MLSLGNAGDIFHRPVAPTVQPSIDLYNETISFTTVDYADIFNYLTNTDDNSSSYEESYPLPENI
mgnify:CR=1 FL=1